MTEDEAKTKWCPTVQLTADSSEWHTNRPGGFDMPGQASSYLCMASACMAWRLQRMVCDEQGYYQDAPEGSGFCGLARAPT